MDISHKSETPFGKSIRRIKWDHTLKAKNENYKWNVLYLTWYRVRTEEKKTFPNERMKKSAIIWDWLGRCEHRKREDDWPCKQLHRGRKEGRIEENRARRNHEWEWDYQRRRIDQWEWGDTEEERKRYWETRRVNLNSGEVMEMTSIGNGIDTEYPDENWDIDDEEESSWRGGEMDKLLIWDEYLWSRW